MQLLNRLMPVMTEHLQKDIQKKRKRREEKTRKGGLKLPRLHHHRFTSTASARQRFLCEDPMGDLDEGDLEDLASHPPTKKGC